jgi:excisionase family DNA binding protein
MRVKTETESDLLNSLNDRVDLFRDGKAGLLTTAEVCILLNVSKMAISSWTRAGTLPHLRIGPALRFEPSRLLAWAKARMIG